MSMRFGRDILPLLLAGGAMAGAKMFSNGSGISEADQDRNNQIWDRLGRGASASPNAMGPDMPGKNPLAGSAPIHTADAVNRSFPMLEPMTGYNLPGHIAGGQLTAQFPLLQQNQAQPSIVAKSSAGLLGGTDPGAMENRELSYHGYNQHPRQEGYETALGLPRNEYMQKNFLRSQGIGAAAPKPQGSLPNVAGGSSTNQSNPFLYAMLYNNNRQVQ